MEQHAADASSLTNVRPLPPPDGTGARRWLLLSHGIRGCVLLFAFTTGACSSSLATLQPARTVPEGHVSAATNVAITPPRGRAGDTLDALKAIDDLPDNPRDRHLRELAETATATLVQPPSLDAQLAVAYGVSRRLELDARVGMTNAGAGLRVQLLRIRPGIYAAFGALATISYAHFPVETFADEVRVDAFRRQDFSFPLTFGYSRGRLHLWGGPKLVFSRYRADVATCLDGDPDRCRAEAQVGTRGRATYLAGQLGAAVGSKRFWFTFEMTIARAWISADVDVEMSARQVEASYRESGRVVTPAFGLLLWL